MNQRMFSDKHGKKVSEPELHKSLFSLTRENCIELMTSHASRDSNPFLLSLRVIQIKADIALQYDLASPLTHKCSMKID